MKKMAPWLSQSAILNPEETWKVALFFLKFIPWIVDEFQEYTVDVFGVDKSEFAAPEWPQSADELVTFRL